MTSQRPATVPWVRSIATVAVLALAAACSGPSREPSGPAPTAQQPAATTQPVPAPARPVTSPPVESVATQEPAVTPPETPMVEEPAPQTRAADTKATPREPAPDPLKAMQEAEARRLEYAQSLPRLASERDAAAESLARRQKDLLAFKNPFMPRPQLAPDEAEEVRGLGGAARVAWAEGRVADATAVLEAAQKAYDDAKANPLQD